MTTHFSKVIASWCKCKAHGFRSLTATPKSLFPTYSKQRMRTTSPRPSTYTARTSLRLMFYCRLSVVRPPVAAVFGDSVGWLIGLAYVLRKRLEHHLAGFCRVILSRITGVLSQRSLEHVIGLVIG